MKGKSKTLHLLILLAIGSLVGWLGYALKTWATKRLNTAWFPDEEKDNT